MRFCCIEFHLISEGNQSLLSGNELIKKQAALCCDIKLYKVVKILFQGTDINAEFIK